jgi:threonine synthase
VHFSREAIKHRPFTIWRYLEAFSFLKHSSIVSLGEGCTPLVTMHFQDHKTMFKLEFVSPTGSYKDRGSAVMVSMVNQMNIDHVVEDSSGNAGASVAAYCAKIGMLCDIYAPAIAAQSSAKLKQIQAYGANLMAVNGSREDVAQAAIKAAESLYYASHQWNPFFNQGTKTFAFEIWEQLRWEVPDAVVVAIGGGGLLLGTYLGFKQLLNSGEIHHMPKIFGVQAEACAPVYQAFLQGNDKTEPVVQGNTIADGISIINPVRGTEILAAVRDTGGAVVTVNDEEIKAAKKDLGNQGLYVEPTSAAAPAALSKLFRKNLLSEGQCVVTALTGSGLKKLV